MTTDDRRLQLTVWAAFGLGIALYPTLLTVIVHQWRPPFDSDLLARLQVNCLAASLLQTGVAFWLFSQAGGASGAGASGAGSIVRYALAWALSEAVGIYGLLVGLWRAEPEVSTLFFTWGIALILVLRPPAARRAATTPPPSPASTASGA
jgi:hypothetical protein